MTGFLLCTYMLYKYVFLFYCLIGRGLVENVWIHEQTGPGLSGGAKEP